MKKVKKGKDTANFRHGHRTNEIGFSPTYNSWRAMKGRCNNIRNCRYQYYGALGIGYDPLWEYFINFFTEMGAKPKNAELHRKDKKKDYNKDNCEWLDKQLHHELHSKERDYSKDFSRRV